MIGKLSILGLGLMGGSLAAAIKKSGYSEHITAWGRSDTSLKRGVELGYIDSWTLDLAEAVAGADVVVVCSPAQVAESLIIDVIQLAGANTVISDVASVKGNIRRAIIAAMGEVPSNVVLAHPIAGAEHSGVEAAKAELYANHKIILTPERNAASFAIEAVSDLWSQCGAEIAIMAVEDHDQILAGTSHLPHMLAYTMISLLSKLPTNHDVFNYAAGGLRDFTRIAASDPQMWTEIALTNKTAILELMKGYQEELLHLTKLIESDSSDELMKSFGDAKASRDYFTSLLQQNISRG